MAKRKRDVPVLFWVSAEELELIHQKMQQYGTENLSAYLRKMALEMCIRDRYKPVVTAAIFEDAAYRNACGHSDRENAVIEGNACLLYTSRCV